MHPAHTAPGGRADFDFLIGTWHSRHRQLRERLKGSNDWEELESTSVIRKTLGGLGNSMRSRWSANRGAWRLSPCGCTTRSRASGVFTGVSA